MKKIIFFVCTLALCLGVNFILLKTTSTLKEQAKIETKNEVVANKNINILKLPLPNTEQRKYSIKKLPINGEIVIKKLNDK